MREPFLKGDGVEGVDYDESEFKMPPRWVRRRRVLRFGRITIPIGRWQRVTNEEVAA